MTRLGKTKWVRFIAIPVIGLSAFAVSCGGDSGVPQEDYDSVKAQLDDAAAEADQAKVALSDAQKKADDAAAEVSALQTQVAEGATDGDSGGEDDVIVVLSAKHVDPPTPPPTPDPAAPTATPAPPRPTMGPEYSEPVGDFVAWVETMATTRASEYNVAGTISCIGTGAFIRGQRIVMRIEVYDITTGLRLTGENAESVTVVWENGDESAGRFSQRGGGRVPGAPFMWSAVWDIPLDYKLGGVGYTIEVVMKDGRTGSYAPPYMASEESDTRPQVFE